MGQRAELLCPKWKCKSNRHARWVATPAATPDGRGDYHQTVFYLGQAFLARIIFPPVAKAYGKETHLVIGPRVELAKVKWKGKRERKKKKSSMREILKIEDSQHSFHHLWDVGEGPLFQIRVHFESYNGREP